MDLKKLSAVLTVLALSSSLCYAGHSGKIRFIGQVVDGGCWNVTGTHDITCQRNNATTHYQISDVNGTPLLADNAIITTRYLDNAHQLEQVEIVFN